MNPRQGLLKPIWFHPLRHLWKLVSDRGYRLSAWLHSRYGHYPRHTPFRCTVDGLTLASPDAASFLSAWDEIFARQLYRCDLPIEKPHILDLGANIGLASLYFLRLFPRAHITAVEPDPEICRYLRENIAANRGDGIHVLQAAAWVEDTELGFTADHGDGGHLAAGGATRVTAIDTRTLLAAQDFDLVKMDIEGAESTVLPTLAKGLARTRLVFVEYHSTPGSAQNLDKIITTLSAAGFHLHIESLTRREHPWMPRPGPGFDMQLNIFGWRP